ncbi:MAG TPA: hypothetical protein VMF32_19810 [Xanthobacteraceae bacterium]|nr:hypothetical protein [Xanthobacteraceae bacterium]
MMSSVYAEHGHRTTTLPNKDGFELAGAAVHQLVLVSLAMTDASWRFFRDPFMLVVATAE